jgi:lysine 2,3-aminomutase
VVDAPGGGGKRDIHSFEYYDRDAGICVYTSPAVKPGYFLYFDPIHSLAPAYQHRWQDPAEQERMIAAAIDAARRGVIRSARASTVPLPEE